MNEENVPDDELRRGLTPIVEEILLHYTEETSRLLMEKARANELRKRFAAPPPLERIKLRPNPHLPEMQFPQHAVIGMPKPGPTEADKEAMRQAVSQILACVNEAVRELVIIIGPAWRETVDELEKAFEGIKVAVRDLPDERDIHPGELRDERGIKQPSHTPPFWAATPGRTSKKRDKR